MLGVQSVYPNSIVVAFVPAANLFTSVKNPPAVENHNVPHMGRIRPAMRRIATRRLQLLQRGLALGGRGHHIVEAHANRNCLAVTHALHERTGPRLLSYDATVRAIDRLLALRGIRASETLQDE